MSAYEGLARYYDALTGDVDYPAWLRWYQRWFAQSETPVELVLDLACGTGTLTCLLAQAGYSMIGADQSEEMLTEALNKAYALELAETPLFLHQSMDALALYGAVDACVCSLDSVNYVLDEAALREAFSRLHTFLVPGGLFLFDVLTPGHLRALDAQTFVDEREDLLCLWRASFDGEAQVLTYGMDLFSRAGRLWRREQEEHQERAWPLDTLRALLREAGFETVCCCDGMSGRPADEKTERAFFVCRNGEPVEHSVPAPNPTDAQPEYAPPVQP